jgi:hypothetical protein
MEGAPRIYPQQTGLVTAQNFASGIIALCLSASVGGKVKPDGTIID